MNPSDNIPSPPDDPRRFDRLVDGELSEPERRTVVLRLEDEPGGWRRCALAFLEAQGWKQAFGAMVDAAAGPSPAARPAARRDWRRGLGTVLAVAASFLLAFVLGMHVRGRPAVPGSGGPLAGSGMAGNAGEAVAGRVPRQAETPGRPPSPATPPERWQLVTLKAPAGPEGEMATIRLPAVQRNTLDQQWLDAVPMAVPDEMLRALRQRGLEVQQHREVLPVEMQDGRRLIVPMDQIEVHYVGRPSL
ncbi:MAG: hypothetical protein ABSG86_03205 [Thermoguttaceae bacterium]|jgi:hypothetical protein